MMIMDLHCTYVLSRVEDEAENSLIPKITETTTITKFEITSFENVRQEHTDAQKDKIQEELKSLSSVFHIEDKIHLP